MRNIAIWETDGFGCVYGIICCAYSAKIGVEGTF
jgi:hypothetical protein